MSLTEISGFFPEYYLNLRNVATETDIEKISQCTSDKKRMEYIDSLEFVRSNDLKIERTFEGKNSSTAAALKEKGNQAFKAMKWLEAMVLYSKSYIALPDEKSAEKSIILANRSATLYHMTKYDETLLDIQRAMDYGYPKDLIYKLYERQARCYLAKKNFSSALLAFQKTVSTLDDAKLPQDKKAKMKFDAVAMITMLQKDPKATKNADKHKEAMVSPGIPDEKSFTSSAIKIDQNKDEGRFARAARDIKVGEEILVEHPFAAVLIEKFAKTHCENCFIRTVIPVACPNCCDVVYCSEKCLKQARESYHKYECGLLETIWRSGASVNCHLALRIIASRPLECFKKIKDEIDVALSIEDIKKLPKNDYRCVSHLVRHENGRTASNFFQHALMARFLTKCLQVSGYFGNPANPEDIILISSLILRNLQFIQFNTHEISELHTSKTKQTEKTVFIGGGIYPTLALFNHSCDPSIVRFFRGTTIHVNTIKPIESGLQISENYGPMYTQETRETRQAKLKDLYWFECSCDPCLENWPRFEEMKVDVIRFRCDAAMACPAIIEVPVNCNDFMVKCVHCGQNTNIFKGLKVMQDTELMTRTAKRLYDVGEYSNALKKFIDLLKIMNEVLAPPFPDYCHCQQSLKDCFLHFGNSYDLE
ncbi:SET and MYND domain-containing protein 4 [Eupeodes corollae]|uniref:SET and MYND domain-containing protein 4 n=1 Tax=Eupeodes corollae TaxID=290404 RepID=UPI0024939689|nr:SET and MYND domain-containing protein 4 [Eupeodes corollae]